MLEDDGVKASTASDPLDVLSSACAFIAVMCKNRNRKNWTGYLRLKTELNRIEPNLKNPNRPALLDPHLIHGSLGPPEYPTQTASRLVRSFLRGSLVWQTDRQTDRPVRTRYSFGNNRRHLHT